MQTAHATELNPLLNATLDVRHPPVDLLRGIISAPGEFRIQVNVTGAAADLVADLVRLPGSSKKISGACIPYRQHQVVDAMGYESAKSVSEETAIGLAQVAYLTAQRTSVQHGEFEGKTPPSIIGLGLTGAVATDRDRRGEDHIWVAVRTVFGISVGHFQFAKGSGDNTRAWQNELANLIALNVLAKEVGANQSLSDFSDIASADCGEIAPDKVALEEVKKDRLDFSQPQLIMPSGEVVNPSIINADTHLVFPGSFKSFHCGHDLAAVNAATVSGKKVIFEISAVNADKAAVDGDELARRALQFRGRYPVLVTPDAPLFKDKSLAYSEGMGFVVGYDTASRLLDLRFYDGQEGKLREVMDVFRNRGNHFYVLGRKGDDGVFRTIRDLPGYKENRDLFRELTGQLNISATALARM